MFTQVIKHDAEKVAQENGRLYHYLASSSTKNLAEDGSAFADRMCENALNEGNIEGRFASPNIAVNNRDHRSGHVS